MNAVAGWYPDPADSHTTRYWDGERYTRELRWDGAAWVDPTAVAPPPPVATTPTPAVTPTPEPTPAVISTPSTPGPRPAVTPAPAVAPTQEPTPAVVPTAAAAASGGVPITGGGGRPTPGVTFWIFMAGSVGVALSALLPWVSVSGFGASISSEPRSGGPVLLIVLAGAVAAIAWPTIASPTLSKARKIGLLPIVGFLALAVVTNWSDLSDLKDQYSGVGALGISVDAGIGFYLYTIAVIALVVAVVRVWLAGARTKASP